VRLSNALKFSRASLCNQTFYRTSPRHHRIVIKLTRPQKPTYTATMSYAPRQPHNQPSGDANVPSEPVGPVASDSLAAQSLAGGGDFAATSDPAPEPLGVPGAKSTLANTETSGATTLPPAEDGAHRERHEALSHETGDKGAAGLKYPSAAGGQAPSTHGLHSDTGTFVGGGADNKIRAAGASDFGASTAPRGEPDPSKISSSATNTSSSNDDPENPGTAPTYAARVSGAITDPSELQPKGTNLTEGGDIPPNRPTFTGDVGGPKDPGRVAERAFEGVNANLPGGGVGRDEEGTRDKGAFGALSGERA
jgi:hypothetical protein